MMRLILPDGTVIENVAVWVDRDETPIGWHCILLFWFAGDPSWDIRVIS